MRRLIVNADDLGASPGVNLGVLEAYRGGIVTSASLLVRGPAAPDVSAMSGELDGLGMGLHLDFGEWVYRDRRWFNLYEVVPLEDPAVVLQEMDRQLDAFRRITGRDPTHVDSHQHVHRGDSIRQIVVDWAEREGVPLRHFSTTVRSCGSFYGQTGIGDLLPELITVPALLQILSDLPDGITELTCHPAQFVDFESAYAEERIVELRTLCHPEVAAAIESLGITLCSFADIACVPDDEDSGVTPRPSERSHS